MRCGDTWRERGWRVSAITDFVDCLDWFAEGFDSVASRLVLGEKYHHVDPVRMVGFMSTYRALRSWQGARAEGMPASGCIRRLCGIGTETGIGRALQYGTFADADMERILNAATMDVRRVYRDILYSMMAIDDDEDAWVRTELEELAEQDEHILAARGGVPL